MASPLLTIGIIFKDNIRSIERCLKALEPLRAAVSCELIMADTGSSDGSRQVAEQYADILFDFPWVNDFSAARNAVMDRASGRWFFTIDTDEYLDPDVSELRRILRRGNSFAQDAISVIQRNYHSYSMDEDECSDFPAVRILHMSTGLRYHGTIHERWERSKNQPLSVAALRKTVLHHDGYAAPATGADPNEKANRNLPLLEETVKENPDELLRWLQLIESGYAQPKIEDYLRGAISKVEEKKPGWERIGPPIFRYAVGIALNRNLPEKDDWEKRARELFPDSLYIRMDVACIMLVEAWNSKDYSACVREGECYLKALGDYRAGRYEFGDISFSSFQSASRKREQETRILLARAGSLCGEYEKTLNFMADINFTRLSPDEIGQLIQVLLDVQFKTELVTETILLSLWEGIHAPELSAHTVKQHMQAFRKAAGPAFTPAMRNVTRDSDEFCRDAYTLFIPLGNQCETGRAACILASNDPQEMERMLSQVENWDEFPIHALAHALEQGIDFPLPEQVLTIEEMDGLAARMAKNPNQIADLICKVAKKNLDCNLRTLTWYRGMAIAAVLAFKWKDSSDPTQGLALARTFAKIESAYLSRWNMPEALQKENLLLLPPMHRFGFYCAQAFDALDRGDAETYVSLLREGLQVNSNMKPMVKFLRDNTPELQIKPEPSEELKALADQIRAVLANFSPDDPAVAALKQSEAYQKVAYLIEGVEAPVMGGLKQ